MLGREAHVPDNLGMDCRRLQRRKRCRERLVELDSVGEVHSYEFLYVDCDACGGCGCEQDVTRGPPL